MAIKGKTKKSDIILTVSAAVLFALLIILTVLLIGAFNRNTSGTVKVPFDIDRITAERYDDDVDISEYLVPEFIGLTVNGTRYGLTASSKVMAELYRYILPVISETVRPENIKSGTVEEWNALPDAGASVYVRYHSEMPDVVIGLLADMFAGASAKRERVGAYVYEMFILPYADGGEDIQIAARSIGGEVYFYTLKSPSAIVTKEELSKLIRSYKKSMNTFMFAGDKFPAVSVTEPVFTADIMTRNILMTNNTVSLIENAESELKRFMRIFSMNPDKLLNTHSEEDGTSSYIDTHGVLYLYASSFEYRAANAGGVPVEDIVGYRDKIGLYDYIYAGAKISAEIRSINKYYAGGDADMILTSVYADGGKVRLVFEYVYDNVLITDIDPAMTLEFDGGVLKKATVYALAVRYVDRSETLSEWWFIGHLGGAETMPHNIGLAYRSDFLSESVGAQWRASLGGTAD